MIQTSTHIPREHWIVIDINHSKEGNLFHHENVDRFICPDVWTLLKVVEKAYKLGYQDAGGVVYD